MPLHLKTGDGDLPLIKEPALLTRCACISHEIYRPALIQSNKILEHLSTYLLDFSDRIRNQFSYQDNSYSYGILEGRYWQFSYPGKRGWGGSFESTGIFFTLPSFVHLLAGIIFSIQLNRKIQRHIMKFIQPRTLIGDKKHTWTN